MGWTLPKNPRSQLKIRVSNVEIQNMYPQSLLEKNTKLESSTKLQKYLKPLIPTLEKYSTRNLKKKHYPTHYYYFRNTKSVRLELNSKDMTLELAWGSQI